MANTKITEMTTATTPLDGTENIPIVQGGANKKASVFQVTAATYGEIYVAGASATQTLTNANTFYKITAFTTDGLSNGVTPAAASDKITIDVTGDYLVQFFITFSDQNNKTFTFRCFNETTAAAYVNTTVKSHSHSTNEMFVAVSAFIQASAGDDIIVQAACASAGTVITVIDATFSMFLLKAS